MKLSRQFTVFGSAIFCVVIFSLYLMLDRGHLDYPKSPRREGSFPQVSPGEWGSGRERAGPVVTRGSAEAPRSGRARPSWTGEARILLPPGRRGVRTAVAATRGAAASRGARS